VRLTFVASFLLLLGSAFAADTSTPIRILVDATDAPRNIFHTSIVLPATPGPLTLVYPKWIPGNHRPSGPIANLTGLKFEANGKSLEWQRDSLEMYAFHVNLPQGSRELTVSIDTITSGESAGATGSAASSQLLDLNWNQVVLYPQGSKSDSVQIVPSIRLPVGWKFGTALAAAHQENNQVEFAPVSLTTLVDSPLIAGSHYREIELAAGKSPKHVIDLVGETDASLQMTPEDLAAYNKLVAETGALFGSRHYRGYHFLYTLSDDVGHHGLEHHESSDNSVGERTLIDPTQHLLDAGLLPHEFIHSWNGKYRRPAGLATPNYQEPMVGDLLWVYEGLTDYLGNVLTARTGLWTAEQYRESLAETAAALDHTAGRSWRPLEDTAVSVQILRLMGPEWESWRRSLDYYPEGDLIWLDVDTKIRQLTQNKKSLNDFCREFHGGQGGAPAVLPYTFDDLVRSLNQVAPTDWATFLNDRVRVTTLHAPMGGITAGGWRLVYDDKPNLFLESAAKINKSVNVRYSLGFWLRKDGTFGDVTPGSPGYQAGIGPGMKLLAVDGRRWTPEGLHQAIKQAQKSTEPIELIVENKGFIQTYSIKYHEGEKNPHLERITDQPDLLSEILTPLSK